MGIIENLDKPATYWQALLTFLAMYLTNRLGYYRGRLVGFKRGHDQTLEFQARAQSALKESQQVTHDE